MTTTDTQVQELVINTLTKQEYEAIQNPSDTELYMVTDDLLANFIGADGTNAGVAGLVPPPQATDNTKFLKGNGSWSNIALSSSDITNALGYTPQNSSTAVTHTANTAVGSSTKPIYISSTGAATASTSTIGGSSTPVYLNEGTITSTGLSIANTRFDGQWVNSFQNIAETSGTQNGVRLSLSSYLPNDTYKYDVKFRMYGYDNDSTYSYFINTDIFWMPSTSSEVTTAYSYLYGGTYSRQNVNIFDLPVGTGRYVKLYGSGADEIKVYALGYRRIGTNT